MLFVDGKIQMWRLAALLEAEEGRSVAPD
jgi:hypothetical protein